MNRFWARSGHFPGWISGAGALATSGRRQVALRPGGLVPVRAARCLAARGGQFM